MRGNAEVSAGQRIVRVLWIAGLAIVASLILSVFDRAAHADSGVGDQIKQAASAKGLVADPDKARLPAQVSTPKAAVRKGSTPQAAKALKPKIPAPKAGVPKIPAPKAGVLKVSAAKAGVPKVSAAEARVVTTKALKSKVSVPRTAVAKVVAVKAKAAARVGDSSPSEAVAGLVDRVVPTRMPKTVADLTVPTPADLPTADRLSVVPRAGNRPEPPRPGLPAVVAELPGPGAVAEAGMGLSGPALLSRGPAPAVPPSGLAGGSAGPQGDRVLPGEPPASPAPAPDQPGDRSASGHVRDSGGGNAPAMGTVASSWRPEIAVAGARTPVDLTASGRTVRYSGPPS